MFKANDGATAHEAMMPQSPNQPARRPPRRPVLAAAVLSAVVLGGPRAAGAQETPPAPPAVTDESVEAAIQKAVQFLVGKRNADGHWETHGNPRDLHWAGTTGLVTLSLLYAGLDPREKEMARTLDWLAAQTLNGTYTYGVRAHALALVPGPRFRSRLEEDVRWLIAAAWPRNSKNPGGYDYTPPPPGADAGRWDNSASQYGVLGVWMAAEAGVAVPDFYWELVASHWTRVQLKGGGWGYEAGSDVSTGSMTAAGVASCFVVLDQLYADRPREAGGVLAAIQLGLNWLAREYGPPNPGGPERWQYYYLYGVERVGRASGYKYFRDKDWFRTGAEFLLSQQRPDGSWPAFDSEMTEVRNTAFGLMFLCHGRAPLLFNKLQLGDTWEARLRDVAGLLRYASPALERLLNWQIVRLDGPLADLLEAPVLYLYADGPVAWTDVEVQKIREYCQRGGLFLMVPGRDLRGAQQAWEELAGRAFPEYPRRALPDDHPLFTGELQFAIQDPPLVLEVHNGLRTLLLFPTRDLATSWNRYGAKNVAEADFQLGCNLYLYATDKTGVRSRLVTPDIAPRAGPVARTIRVARIRYDGAWDVEPYGWTRLGHYLNNEAAARLLVSSGITLDSDALKEFRIAFLSGTGAFTLSPEEIKGLRRFLSGGGTLLADAAGGSREFVKSLETAVRAAQKSEPRAVPADSPLITGRGIPGATSLENIGFRRAARAVSRGQQFPRLMAFGTRRRLEVIYSPLDLSTGLLGTPAYGVLGYDPDSALKILRNLLLYADLPNSEKSGLEPG